MAYMALQDLNPALLSIPLHYIYLLVHHHSATLAFQLLKYSKLFPAQAAL